MTDDLKAHARRLLDTRTVVAFIAGFIAWQIVMAVWHVLLPILIVATGVILLTRWMTNDEPKGGPK